MVDLHTAFKKVESCIAEQEQGWTTSPGGSSFTNFERSFYLEGAHVWTKKPRAQILNGQKFEALTAY